MKNPRCTFILCCAVVAISAAAVSAHLVKGLTFPALATAFVSSPTATADAPIPIVWASQDSGLRVVCFNVANTSPERIDRAGWPRITVVGFELPDSRSGFSLVTPLDGGWRLAEGADANVLELDDVTLDFAVVADVNPVGRAPGSPDVLRGIPPGQPGVRGAGTRFCISGPFPDRLPDLTTADPEDTVATTIEGLLNGVVIGFHGVVGSGPGTDEGIWFPPPGVVPRTIPLYR